MKPDPSKPKIWEVSIFTTHFDPTPFTMFFNTEEEARQTITNTLLNNAIDGGTLSQLGSVGIVAITDPQGTGKTLYIRPDSIIAIVITPQETALTPR